MTLETLVSKYIRNTGHVFADINIVQNESTAIEKEKIETVIETAKHYFADAKYYYEKSKFETSLVSVVYCEGLLDALKLLGAVKFSWPSKK
jgi:FAD synthetase